MVKDKPYRLALSHWGWYLGCALGAPQGQGVCLSHLWSLREKRYKLIVKIQMSLKISNEKMKVIYDPLPQRKFIVGILVNHFLTFWGAVYIYYLSFYVRQGGNIFVFLTPDLKVHRRLRLEKYLNKYLN